MLSCDTAEFPRLTASLLVEQVRQAFRRLPDARKGGNNQRYTLEDAALSAFSVFFTQSPSFLDYRKRMQKARGRNNATSLFGVHRIPSDRQIRNLLDPVPPQELAPLSLDIVKALYRRGALETYRACADGFLVTLDGTQYFASEAISCPNRSTRTLANGTVQHFHTAVTPVPLAPGQETVFPLPPAFVTPRTATPSRIASWRRARAGWHSERRASPRDRFPGRRPVLPSPFSQQVLAPGCHFPFVCRSPMRPSMSGWRASSAPARC